MNRGSTIIAACVMSAVAGMMFNTMPVFLGAAADAYGFGEEQIGFMATAYLLGFTLVSLSAVFWIHRTEWRTLVLGGFSLALVVYYLYLGASNFGVILGLQFVLGICFGAVYNVALRIVSDTSDPDRYLALKIFSEIGLGAALLYFLPNYVMNQGLSGSGMNGILYTMMAVVMLGALAIHWLPLRAVGAEVSITGHQERNWPLWMSLGALLLHFGGMTAIWAFQYEVGTQSGLEPGAVGTVMSVSILVSMVATLAAAAISDRYGRIKPMLVSLILVFVSLLLFFRSAHFLHFAIACGLVSIGWNYILPYQMGVVVDLDVTGRLSILISAALTLGGAIGPGVAGIIVAGKGYTGLYILVGLAALVSTAVFIALIRKVPVLPVSESAVP